MHSSGQSLLRTWSSYNSGTRSKETRETYPKPPSFGARVFPPGHDSPCVSVGSSLKALRRLTCRNAERRHAPKESHSCSLWVPHPGSCSIWTFHILATDSTSGVWRDWVRVHWELYKGIILPACHSISTVHVYPSFLRWSRVTWVMWPYNLMLTCTAPSSCPSQTLLHSETIPWLSFIISTS